MRYIRPRSLPAGVSTTSSRHPDRRSRPRDARARSVRLAAQPRRSARTIAHGCRSDSSWTKRKTCSTRSRFSWCCSPALGLFLYQVLGALQPAACGRPVPLHARSDSGAHPGRPGLRVRAEEVRPPRSRDREGAHGGLAALPRVLGLRRSWASRSSRMFARAYLPDFYLFPFTPGLLGRPYWFVRDIFEVARLRLRRDPVDALAGDAAEPALRLHAGRGAAPPPLALGGVPDPRLHRHDHGLGPRLRRQPAAPARCRHASPATRAGSRSRTCMSRMAGVGPRHRRGDAARRHGVVGAQPGRPGDAELPAASPSTSTSSPRCPTCSSRSSSRSASCRSRNTTRTRSATARRTSTTSPGSRCSTCSAAPSAGAARRSVPATATGKPLAPRQLLLDLRDYLYKHQDEVIAKRVGRARPTATAAPSCPRWARTSSGR